MPYPLNSAGYIDEKEIFKILVGTLNKPIEYMDELTFTQLGWLFENYIENEKMQMEQMAHALKVGYLQANGKKVKLFEDAKKQPKKIDIEDKAKEMADLKSFFKGCE